MAKRKVRVTFRKNRENRQRTGDLTKAANAADDTGELGAAGERVRAKGALSRKRTVVIDDQAAAGARTGRIMSVQGLHCVVVTDEGESQRCFVRRLLKSVGADSRSVLAVGDRVSFRPAETGEGMIERVEPRGRCLVRRYRGREQIVAANVEQALVVSALADPELKPPLIDRYLARIALSGLKPILCFNKCDLPDAWRAQPIFGLYAQLGYAVVTTSTLTGRGLAELRDLLRGHDTVVVGQSGVGKSSLLNALEPKFALAVGEVSEGTRKGKHTTTTARWLGLDGGGCVIDTPGVRQFELADLDHDALVAGFPEFGPFLPGCRYGGCRHGEDEAECGVAQAVVDRLVSGSRYDGYLRVLEGDLGPG